MGSLPRRIGIARDLIGRNRAVRPLLVLLEPVLDLVFHPHGVRLHLLADLDEVRRVGRPLESIGDDQGHRLVAVPDDVVLQCLHDAITLIGGLGPARKLHRVQVREHREHARLALGGTRIDGGD